MDKYINNYYSYDNSIIYNFNIGHGGIGDCIKYFMFILDYCIHHNIRLYYKKNNIDIEHLIELKHHEMYIEEHQIKDLVSYQIVESCKYYNLYNDNFNIPIKDVFFFSKDVILNSKILFPFDSGDYISIHLRLGDNYLETDKSFIQSPYDTRHFSDEKIHKFIEDNSSSNIFFCCDNNQYKLKLKEKYNNILVSNCAIGHTSLTNTSKQQILDAVSEFYILTNSRCIFCASKSGFSTIASKFNNIPLLT